MCIVLRDIFCFFFQAEDGIRDLVRSRGLGDVYKRQLQTVSAMGAPVSLHLLEMLFNDLPQEQELTNLSLSLIHI